MIPNDRLATSPNYAPFQAPRDRVKTTLVDYHLGGDQLGDPGNGLRVKTWSGHYTDGAIFVTAAAVEPAEILTPSAAIAEFSFCFNQNMQPVVAYELAAGGSAMYWFDPDADDYVTLSLTGARSPRVTLDDSRPGPLAAGDSDVLLTYLRGDAMYFRQQREAFAVEHELATGLAAYRIGRFGMNTRNAMQWEMVTAVPASPAPAPATILRAIDTRLFRAFDGSAQDVGLGVWLAAAGAGAGWTGCKLEISRDEGGTWEFIGTQTVAAVLGELTTDLPLETDEPDETSIFRVAMVSGSLASVDPAQLGDFRNLALVGAEQLQFANAAAYGAAEFEVDYLLRGRNSTTIAAHDVAARFTMLDASRLLFVPLDAYDVGQELRFRATTLGGIAPSGSDIITFQGLSAAGT